MPSWRGAQLKHRDNFIFTFYCFNVGPCHYGMAHPQVVHVGCNLQIWKVAVNISNKQSQSSQQGVVLQLEGWAGFDNSSP
jgi:hypothetical protein